MNKVRAAKFTLVALSLVSALAASAEIRFEPAVPVANQPFSIVFEGVWRDGCVPSEPRLEVFDRLLFVTFKVPSEGGCTAALTPWTAKIEGVRLSGNDYTLDTRVEADSLEQLFDFEVFKVSGPASAINVFPSSDSTSGNQVALIYGTFDCNTSPCNPPEVFFGANRSPAVRREPEGHLSAVVPPGNGLVDVTVVAAQTFTKRSAFQYLSRSDWEGLLVPVYSPVDIDGALGSRWHSDLTLLNQNRAPLMFGYDVRNVYYPCHSLCMPEGPLDPDATVSGFEMNWPNADGAPPIALLHVRKEAVSKLALSLRTRDLTRQSENWGCEIPIVRESELLSVVTLVDVPREERFRQRLRIYDPLYPAEPVKVEFHLSGDGELLATREIELAWTEGTIGGLTSADSSRAGSPGFPLQPAFVELDLASIPELEGYRRLWIRVTARSGQKIWAFVSITNNETQHVSTVTPQ